MNRLRVNKCANSGCDKKFRRLGEGCLTVLPVNDPLAWGLPEDVKQKVVWICGECSQRYRLRLDRKQHTIELVSRARGRAA